MQLAKPDPLSRVIFTTVGPIATRMSVVGDEAVKRELGARAKGREAAASGGQESRRPYRALFDGENEALRPENTLYWKESLESTEA